MCAVCFAFPWFIQDFLPGVESRFYLFISVRSLLCFPLVYTGFLARGGEEILFIYQCAQCALLSLGLYRISCQGWRVDSIYLSVCAVCFAFPWFIQDFLPGVESRFYLFISVRSVLCFPLVYTGFLARGGE